MVSSGTSASWSPDSLLDDDDDEPTRFEAPRASTDGGDGKAKRVTSRLRTRKTLRDICKKYSIPDEFAPVLAGDLSSCSPPHPGSVCVYVDALDAGMRLPLHPFYGAVLSHFGFAPGQLVPNSWRTMAGFIVLSHFAGVEPLLAVFQHFFTLSPLGHNKLYSLRSKDNAGMLFCRFNGNIKGWREEFFFLSSSAPWLCPVRWGAPSRSSTLDPTLTPEEKGVADELLRARGDCPIDLTRYLHEGNLAAAKIIRPASSPSPTRQGMEAPVNVTMEDVRAEEAAATARATAGKVTVKSEPVLDCDVPPCTPSLGKKRKLEEDHEKGESSAADMSCPPGFSKPLMPPATSKDCGKQWSALRQHRGGDTGDWQAARQLLQGIVTPSRELELAASKPANVVASSFVSLLQTANEVAFSLDYALELEDKLRARDREADTLRAREREAVEAADALRAELRKAKAELEDTKAAQGSSSREHARALAERELRGYERGMEDMKRATLRRYPNLDPARLVVPLHTPTTR